MAKNIVENFFGLCSGEFVSEKNNASVEHSCKMFSIILKLNFQKFKHSSCDVIIALSHIQAWC